MKSLRGASFTIHCTVNLKHIFPEMKQQGLVPSFYIHVSGSDLYIPTSVLFGIMDHKWKQLILVVNFLFGLGVNEIPNNIGFSPALHLQYIYLDTGLPVLAKLTQ